MLGHQQVIWSEKNLKITETVNTIAGQLGDEHWSVRQAVVKAFQNHHNLSPENVNAIASWLGDKDWSVQKEAIHVLENHHNLGPEHVNAIVGRLADENQYV